MGTYIGLEQQGFFKPFEILGQAFGEMKARKEAEEKKRYDRSQDAQIADRNARLDARMMSLDQASADRNKVLDTYTKEDRDRAEQDRQNATKLGQMSVYDQIQPILPPDASVAPIAPVAPDAGGLPPVPVIPGYDRLKVFSEQSPEVQRRALSIAPNGTSISALGDVFDKQTRAAPPARIAPAPPGTEFKDHTQNGSTYQPLGTAAALAGKTAHDSPADLALKTAIPLLESKLKSLYNVVEDWGTTESANPSWFRTGTRRPASGMDSIEASAALDQLPYEIALLYAKVVDPTSVVREGEVAAAQKYMLGLGLTANNAQAKAKIQSMMKTIQDRRALESARGLKFSELPTVGFPHVQGSINGPQTAASDDTNRQTTELLSSVRRDPSPQNKLRVQQELIRLGLIKPSE